MAVQVSYESAVAAYEKKCGEMLHTTVLLEAQLSDQAKRIAELDQENTALREQAPQDEEEKGRKVRPVPLAQAVAPGAAGEPG